MLKPDDITLLEELRRQTSIVHSELLPDEVVDRVRNSLKRPWLSTLESLARLERYDALHCVGEGAVVLR